MCVCGGGGGAANALPGQWCSAETPVKRGLTVSEWDGAGLCTDLIIYLLIIHSFIHSFLYYLCII